MRNLDFWPILIQQTNVSDYCQLKISEKILFMAEFLDVLISKNTNGLSGHQVP